MHLRRVWHTSGTPPVSTTAPPCNWCGRPILGLRVEGPGTRARVCSQSCRQAQHRFGRDCPRRAWTSMPLRLAYADPPYPGLARRYYQHHPDYAGEVDHDELLGRLEAFDGWALSTSAEALPKVLALCVRRELEVRVGSWVKGGRPGPARRARSSWEPVIYRRCRDELEPDRVVDSLHCRSRGRPTDPRHVIGSKPARFAWWMFELIGGRPGDDLRDLFPGSGGIGRAWNVYTARAIAEHDASRLELQPRRVAWRRRDGSAENDVSSCRTRRVGPRGRPDVERDASDASS